MSGPVPKHLRNPRRGYDAEGQEIAPATVGHVRAEGDTTVSAWCQACGRHAVISTDGLPDDHPVPDIALRLRCSACDSRQITVTLDMAAHYARLRAKGFGVGGSGGPDFEKRVVLRPFAKPHPSEP